MSKISGLKPVEYRTRMFDLVKKTWNPICGCEHDCGYCWARYLAKTKLRLTPRYRNGFAPQLVEKELRKRFHNGYMVFVSDMGDMFGEFIPSEWIRRVLQSIIRSDADVEFLLQTKNPARFHEFLDEFPPNMLLGATIESNRDHHVSKAPSPERRYLAMWGLNWHPKMVSVEPILDFDEDIFLRWLQEIKPDLVYVGYDNYHRFTKCRLEEPSRAKTEHLIAQLEKFTKVRRKTIREAVKHP